jgi:cobaltochelatase CobN
VTTEFVLQGKTDKLARLAAASGLALEALRVEQGVEPARIAGADLVILDTPRPNDLAKVQGAVGPLLAGGTVPWLRVGGGPPGFGNLPPPQARSLMGYYAAGGQANFVGLFAAIRNWRSGGDLAGLPAPSPLPRSGIYHPDAPRVFESVDAYLAWGRSRWAENAPRMAVVTYLGLISGMETAVLDDLVRRAEAAGVVPVPFWSPSSDPAGIESWVAGSAADVLVVATHLQNGTARAAEFLKLGIPVNHTVGFRDGGRSNWEQATSGIMPQMVAPFLAVPEGWGASDPMVIEAVENGEPVPLPDQVTALVAKAKRLAVLRNKPAFEKRVALLFWNYPPGEKNLAASNLNLPRSLERLTRALSDAGYDVPSTAESALIEAGQAMLGAVYHPVRLEELDKRGLVAALPFDRYRAWFDSLPADQRAEIVARWGEPEAHAALRSTGGKKAFLLPRLRLGNLELMPQLPRGGRPGENYHDAKVPPDHLYLAQYLYLRELSGADALIHFGTHGTQEWTPGKDRGLSVRDYPYLTIGDLPVFYPYIQDNVGEAVQAKRRGRAVTISHQTPPFAPAGLYDELRDLHSLVHEYQQMEEGVAQEATAARIRKAVSASNTQRDMGWDLARMESEFPAFLNALHDHLHRLAEHAMPLGLHTFGEPAAPEHRLATVMQQLGPPFSPQARRRSRRVPGGRGESTREQPVVSPPARAPPRRPTDVWDRRPCAPRGRRARRQSRPPPRRDWRSGGTARRARGSVRSPRAGRRSDPQPGGAERAQPLSVRARQGADPLRLRGRRGSARTTGRRPESCPWRRRAAKAGVQPLVFGNDAAPRRTGSPGPACAGSSPGLERGRSRGAARHHPGRRTRAPAYRRGAPGHEPLPRPVRRLHAPPC